VVLGIAISYVLELELAIESDEPARETKKKFREGRVYVEVIFP
jgi:hypothetical protein